MQVATGLLVDRQISRAHRRKPLQIAFWLLDHQVHVERQRGGPTDRLDDDETEADVRDEVAIHDVNVDQIHASRLSLADLIGQMTKVCIEHGGREPHPGHGAWWYDEAPADPLGRGFVITLRLLRT